MKLLNFVMPIFFVSAPLIAAGNPDKLYTNTYDGRAANFGDWNYSFFRKGSDIVSLDWNTKKETLQKCNVPVAPFYAYQISQQDSIYLLKRSDTTISDGWIIDLSGSCLQISQLVTDFPSSDISRKLFYSEKLKQLVVASSDYRIAPTDGKINVFIDPKTKTIVSKTPGNFSAGFRAVQDQNTAVSISEKGRFLNFYNTDSFTLEKSVDFGKIYISKLYLKESIRLGLSNQYLISGTEQGTTFLGYYDKATDQITKRFDIGCYELQFSLENNTALCFATPPGGPWKYYSQDLTTGETTLIWDNLWLEPKLSAKNSMVIANYQNGAFTFYNLKTKQQTDIFTDANANTFFFLDKKEENIITVSSNWNGKVEIEKFSILDPSKTTLLYTLEIPAGDDYGYVIFNAEKNKLYIPLNSGGAYYLDIK